MPGTETTEMTRRGTEGALSLWGGRDIGSHSRHDHTLVEEGTKCGREQTRTQTSKFRPNSTVLLMPEKLRPSAQSHNATLKSITTCHTCCHQSPQQSQHQNCAGKSGYMSILSTYSLQGVLFYLIYTTTPFSR